MPQFLINSTDVKGNQIDICDKDNYNHIAKSLRTKIGEKLLLIDENQIQYETIVSEINSSCIKVKIEKKYRSERKLSFNLYLAQVPLKSDGQQIVVEKATELGVDGIFPILSDNCAVKKDIIEKKIPKWQRIMFEAFKQCERAYVPKCYELTSFENILKMKNKYKIIAFCERFATLTLHQYCEQNPINQNDKIIIIIGPEGGFSKPEFETLKENSIPMITLGNMILKAETAVITAIGNIIYEYENYRKN